MARYTCKICGETCISKNVRTRNIFPDDFIAVSASVTMPTKIENNKMYIEIDLRSYYSKEEALKSLYYRIGQLINNEGSLAHFICSETTGHVWELTEGEEL